MAASRRSLKRTIPQPLKASRRTNAISLGITSAGRSAIGTGSATMTQSLPAETRKSSLRSAGPKTPSPDAYRVRFAGAGSAMPEDSHHYPRTSGAVSESQTCTMSKDPTKRTTRASPTLQLSPRTTQKAREAAKVVREQTAFIDEKFDSPPPISSKKNNFQGRGNRVSTGQPPTPEQLSHARYDDKTPSGPGKAALPTPPTTVRPNKTSPRTSPNKRRTTSPPIRKITITETEEQRQIYIDGVSDWLSFPFPPTQRFSPASPPIEIPTSALLQHMATLKTSPRPLALEELHINFYLLQKMLRQFTKRHFRTPWSESRRESFASNFADLATTSAPFYRIAAYLADGSTFQDGWTSFLSSEHTRPHLAYAILSEWLKYNVFGHSCFGLSEAEDDLMTAIDIRYLHYDGFVRTKERAKLLRRILAEKSAWEVEMDMGNAIEKVVSDLLIVLGPILTSQDAKDGQMVELRAQLTSLIDVAANLHLCIRLTGMNGTILRFQSSAKGDQFAYTARQNCVNKSTVSETVDEMIDERNRQRQSAASKPAAKTAGAEAGNDAADELTARIRDKLVIKVPCFPHVLGVVPFGPTLRDFAVEQDVYSQTIRSEDLPPLTSDSAGPMYIEDVPAEIVRAGCLEAMPESCHRDYGRRIDDGETRAQAYGSYVKQYVLNESDVYCEWEFEGEVNADKGMTLRDAVEQAQREKYGYIPSERRATWVRRKEVGTNLVKALTTVGVAAAVGYGVARHTTMGMNAVSAIKNLGLPESLSIEDVKGAVKSAMKAADARTKTFQKAARLPYKITKEHTKRWAYAPLAAAKSQFASARLRAQQFIPGAGGVPDLASCALTKASDLAEAATSVVKAAVLGEETPEATPTAGLLSGILEPIHIAVHETPVKLGIELGRIAEPTSRVSKTTKTAASKTATAVARWYEQMVPGGGN